MKIRIKNKDKMNDTSYNRSAGQQNWIWRADDDSDDPLFGGMISPGATAAAASMIRACRVRRCSSARQAAAARARPPPRSPRARSAMGTWTRPSARRRPSETANRPSCPSANRSDFADEDANQFQGSNSAVGPAAQSVHGAETTRAPVAESSTSRACGAWARLTHAGCWPSGTRRERSKSPHPARPRAARHRALRFGVPSGHS